MFLRSRVRFLKGISFASFVVLLNTDLSLSLLSSLSLYVYRWGDECVCVVACRKVWLKIRTEDNDFPTIDRVVTVEINKPTDCFLKDGDSERIPLATTVACRLVQGVGGGGQEARKERISFFFNKERYFRVILKSMCSDKAGK